ncbi:receptor kinase 1 [Olea europaea subsp. europaea]|uniref:non-specific serine/threonine protein kinase n=1 Tax=Olea europaea subsp. europaea TaxID=158383 RepID=A0A8S0R095_OLEEU|nr:receptor kinase 1 [Olea europaea subsp. europaea]
MGTFQASDHFQANASDKGFGIKRRLTLDNDGNLRIYSLINSAGLWMIMWQAISQPCQVHEVCGRYAVCIYAPKSKCICTSGYEVKNPSDWSGGCKPAFRESLLNSRVNFVEVPHIDYFGSDFDFKPDITLEACRELCLGDSHCNAFTYKTWGAGRCNVKSELFNGLMSPDFPGSTYIKLPNRMQVSKPSIFNGSSTMCESREAEILVGNMVFPASVEAGYFMISSQFKRFSSGVLKKATNNFREELGQGSSGIVYKGILADDRVMAVKRLGDVFQGQDEFLAEIRTIGEINYMNIVRMWGFCSEGRQRLLVYEYVNNLSLDKHLLNSNFLGWKQRCAVALGTAKGLAYLHNECLEWVIHCDVKPKNILLDGELQPKIADFGLAKLSRRDCPGSEISNTIWLQSGL